MTGAIIGASALGAASSYSSSKKASSAAAAATESSEASSAAQLAFTKEQYADWKNTFGGLSENLSDFYNNLTPAHYEASGVQNLKETYASATKNIDQALAQRGIASSGLQAQAMTDLASSEAKAEAEVRTQAPYAVAQQQMSFLSLGMNQGQNAVNNVTSSYGQQAQNFTNTANQQLAMSNQAAQGVGSSLSSGINSYMTYNAMQDKNSLLSALVAKTDNRSNT